MRAALLAPVLALALVARTGGAQDAQPVANVRVDAPLGLMLEAGLMAKTLDQPEGFGGPTITAAVGTGGARIGAGWRMVAMMGVNLATQGVVVRTWRNPLGARPDQLYVGGEVRGGILFGSVGVGALVRVAGEEPGGSAVRLTASVGIGL